MQTIKNNSIIWLRRSLRLDDNKVIEKATASGLQLVFVFVFDSLILKRFKNKQDRRLSFIISSLEIINNQLEEYGAKLFILYGDSREVIPNFAEKINATKIYTELDFEPLSIQRDEFIKEKLKENCDFIQALDHLLIHPSDISKNDGSPFKVFTPFMKIFRNSISSDHLKYCSYNIKNKIAPFKEIVELIYRDLNNSANSINIKEDKNFIKINIFNGDNKKDLLKIAGYEYYEDELWQPKDAKRNMYDFIDSKLSTYHTNRNKLDIAGTSSISPFLRFGNISIRELFSLSIDNEVNPNYTNELIWREFYTYIIYYFPETINTEFQHKYRNNIKWKFDEKKWELFKQGNTGFPVVDAAVRQLVNTGWMHNRARMIVANFLTKNLFFDWRLGEDFFANYLMDYDLASNVGGWQWSASTGTDAAPYFRIFNPTLQGQRFDTSGDYVRKFVPELKEIPTSDIHNGEVIAEKYKISNYNAPIVDYKFTRDRAISYFKNMA